jgi:coenzyme F420-reducing hydrogenase alpha subunit
MHQQNFDLSIDEISKIEGHAALDLKVRNGKLQSLKFRIADYKRFYTKAVEGKQIAGVPQQVARICGTCSNAHLLCSIKTIENALNLKVSGQTKKLRKLLNYGLIIRDHALHLYVFVLPDLIGKDSILDFDENIKSEHKLLHDTFAVKEAGNLLSIWAGGRSVHAPYAAIGGFTKLPQEPADKIIRKLKNIRPKIIYLIDLFAKDKSLPIRRELSIVFAALDNTNFSFLNGNVITSDNRQIPENEFYNNLTPIEISYSHASGYKMRQASDRNLAPDVVRGKLKDKIIMVGALARLNLLKERLHKRTLEDISSYLGVFPSNNIFDNNLAQAIEILHTIDSALDLLENFILKDEKPVSINPKKSTTGVGLIEAPRGILFHEYLINEKGQVESAKIVVPTGLNQILIEQSLKIYLSDKLTLPKEKIALEAEKLIRAFDPCISCASHFLKVNWA